MMARQMTPEELELHDFKLPCEHEHRGQQFKAGDVLKLRKDQIERITRAHQKQQRLAKRGG
jgi:hypothetical protein